MSGRVLTIATPEVARAGWLVEAARAAGLTVGGLEVPGERYYWGGPEWAAAHQDALGVGLLEPPDEWLTTLPAHWLRRPVRLTTLAEARRTAGAFIKPPRSKDFPARVYARPDDVVTATAGLSEETPALVCGAVEFAVEYRFFVLDGRVYTGSRYATWGHLDPGTLGTREAIRVVEAVEEMLGEVGTGLPSAVVLDAGLVGPPEDPRRDVAVVEANMAWFAQPYWSDPARVLDAVLRSASPLGAVADADRRFLRS